MPDLTQIAAEIDGAWPQIVVLWEEFRALYGMRLRADIGDTNQRDFLEEALGAAYAKKRLGALVDLLKERKLVTPTFSNLVAPLLGEGFELQAHVNKAFPVQYAAVWHARMRRACEYVCRIRVDNKHAGTGVLIAPNLVATAAHVIKGLVDVVPDRGGGADRGITTVRQSSGSLARLEVLFSSVDPGDDENFDAKSVPARLHENWLLHFSSYANGEGSPGYEVISTLGIDADGPWDLAVIRLESPLTDRRSGCAKLGLNLQDPSFGIFVLHHAAGIPAVGTPMLHSPGEVRQALGVLKAKDSKPTVRLLHTANTDHGSSGAPCFDSDWSLVALHQAGPASLTSPNQVNRAVPVNGWASKLEGWTRETEAIPFLMFVDDDQGRRVPVIGRRDLQAALWRAMTGANPTSGRTFIVRGGARLGKTFTLALLRGLAKASGHPVTSLDVRNALEDDAAAFAQRILGALAATVAGNVLSPTQLTTDARDVRNDVAPKLLDEIARIAAGRQLWILLDGFDAAAFPTTSTVPQLVEQLLARIDLAPGLHLVVTGWHAPPGRAFLETLEDPVPQAIAEHVLTSLNPGREIPQADLAQVTGVVNVMLPAEPPSEPYERANAVVTKLRVLAMALPPQAPGRA